MNGLKVEQVLKVIINRYGFGILYDRPQFRAVMLDLLDPVSCKDEHIVLKHAMDTDAFWFLLTANVMTYEISQNAVEQLKVQGHFTEEDARFVVQCIVAARSSQNIVSPQPADLGQMQMPYQTGNYPPRKPKKSDEWIVAMILIGVAGVYIFLFIIGMMLALLSA